MGEVVIPVDVPSNGRVTRGGRALAVVSLLAATLFWSGNYIVGAEAVRTVDPLSLVWLRWVVALIPLVVVAHLAERPDWRRLWSAWPRLLLLAASGLLAYSLFLYAALEYTSAFNASLINAFNPALIAVAAAIVLRERLTPIAVVGVLVALVGVLVVICDGDLSALLGTAFGTGDLLMIGAVIAWTVYTLAGRRTAGLPPIASTAAQAVLSVVVLAPVVWSVGGPTLPDGPGPLGSLLFIAVFPSVLSYLLWNRALRVLPAGSAGVYLNLITVFTAMFTVLTGQPYSAAQVVGGMIVIVGVVGTSGVKRRAAPGAGS
ncbi:Threonine/homoserine efflux transporter RhtA [Pseudonocardia ammonioxydans]|uniref:Threonine/homoserine efflux transporter RhtA n=1 Tax=Pseudonocardia ammonioxydans TaxID=260086 RepID=A0A1I4ZU17_PSUAM|nr:DMT family transporter [Pseudonocardia ammonioxydans]SFN53500.1 Threonine/homoserine efflux transporter RhtA [Pseudonocardia ammonioxydans]